MIGQAISHYRVVDKLGGGIGAVYKAEDVKLAALWRSSFCPTTSPKIRSIAGL
jgi:hypothetical protein